MSLVFLKSWRFWAVLIVLGVIASTGYFAVRQYSKTLKENTQLQQAVAVAQGEKKALEQALKGISDAVDKNDTSTRTIIERTNTVERAINALPVTKDCVSAPSVAHALGVLRQRQQASSPDPVSGQSVPVYEQAQP